jgi:archaemetzincin
MIPVGDDVHRLACRHGRFSGRLRAGVDGAALERLQPEKLDLLGLYRRYPLTVAGETVFILLRPTLWLTTRIDLVAGGKSIETGKPIALEPIRRNGRMLAFLAYYLLVAAAASLALRPVIKSLAERLAYKGAWTPELGGKVSTEEALARIPALSDAERARAAQILRQSVKLRAHFAPIERPGPNDWLYNNLELGQTFADYVAASPLKPEEGRRVIYLRPVGRFTPEQLRVLDLTGEFLASFYNLPVKVLDEFPLIEVPSEARRYNSTTSTQQVLTKHVADRILRPTRPKDALFYLAFTSSDLWVGHFNFVYGQAFPKDGLGVWSIYRNGDPAEGPGAFRLCLRRTVKTAAHEIGHLVGIRHCTSFDCCMCGVNNREEGDRRPLPFCPECISKVLWVFNPRPAERYAKLRGFCERNGLGKEADLYAKLERALR